jgi:hypothetical protein
MKSVVTKIALMIAEFGAVAKDGRNEHSKFDFISYEQLNAIVRPLMAKHNLIIVPNITDYDEVFSKVVNRTWDTKKNDYVETEKELVRTRLKGTVKVVCGETGDVVEFGMVGGDQDYGGKSMSKAVTEFDKRALFKLFKVSSKQDVDPDSVTVEKEEPAKPKTTQESKKPATPTKTAERIISDSDIKKAREIAGLKPEWIIDTVKEQFSKTYGELTNIEKTSLLKLIEKELNK